VKKLVSLIVLGAVVLAACGSGSNAVAATVDGREITVSDVEALFETDGEAVTKEQFAQFLGLQIQWDVIFAAAEEDYGVTATDEEIAAEADSLMAEVLQEGETREQFLADRGITEAFLTNVAHQRVLDDGISAQLEADVPEPTTEEIDTERAVATASLTTACVSHILVETEEEAQDVLDRLAAGEDFGDLAMEVSTDTGSGANGGDLSCASPSTYVDPFRDAVMVAPVGEVYEQPVESEFGFHVILVTERDEPDEADLPTDEELMASITDEAVLAALEDWFLGALETADVSVGEEYGTWVANPPGVTPPVSESGSTTTTTG